MSFDAEKAKGIFNEALELDSGAQREVYLERACAADDALRREVDTLLSHHAGLGSFLHEEPGVEPAGTDTIAGTRIGQYELVEEIGEGGFGVVYLAEQAAPIRRQVALKVLKAGMDTREVVSRFEAERQALALMDHPGIARVFDGGATPGGRPYFVMELVQGTSINAFCDQARLSLRQRLKLFVRVCQAVQHAHQKGVIHRDIKPSNVLVAEQDGGAAPKVIDFGIAKAVGQSLTEKTLQTRLGHVIGTPQYMSPEQADMSTLDVDTRSDVYSLGVLLYELLTGTTPFTPERLREATFDELRRMIRIEDPPTPSARLTALNGRSVDVASHRRTGFRRLVRSVHGELDWIVMKALGKEPARRYQTASGFADDVERYLADEPVEAGPPSAWYRVRKFTRRHRAGVTLTAFAVALVVVGVGVAGWMARDRAGRQIMLDAAITAALAEAESSFQAGRLTDAMAAVERSEGLAAGGESSGALAEDVRRWRRDLEMVMRLVAARQARAAVKHERFDRAAGHRAYKEAFRGYGLELETLDLDEATARIEDSAIREPLAAALQDWLDASQGPAIPASARDSTTWREGDGEPTGDTDRLGAIVDRTDADPWRRRFREAVRRADPAALEALARGKEALAQPPATLVSLAHALVRSGRLDRAVDLLEESQWSHPGDFWINHELAYYLATGTPPRLDEAVSYYRAALAVWPDSAGAYLNLGVALHDCGDDERALSAYRKALVLKPDYTAARCNLAKVLLGQGKTDEAVKAIRRAIELQPDSAFAHLSLAFALRQRQDYEEAVAVLRRAVELDPKAGVIRSVMGDCLGLEMGDWPAACEAYREALSRTPDHVPSLLGLGNALRELGDLDEAIEKLRRAVKLTPDEAGSHDYLGTALIERNPIEAAISFRRAIELDSGYVDGHSHLGTALLRARKPGEALKPYREAIRLAPDDGRHHYNLGLALEALARLDEAIESYRRATRTAPPFVDSHAALGVVLVTRGDLKKALPILRTALERNSGRPQDAFVHAALGQCFMQSRAWTQAVSAFKRAVELHPDNIVGHAGLSRCLQRTGDLPGALEAGRRWAELDPRNASAQYGLGCLLSNSNRFEESVEPFRRASALAPSFAEAHCNLGTALMRAGKPNAEALAALLKSIEIKPDLFHGHNNLANLLVSQGEWERALTHHRKLAALLPDDPTHQMNLAETLVRTGRLAEAAGQFEKALAMLQENADAHNAAAWMLSSPPAPDSVGKQAVNFAERAVALVPGEGAFHNTLGVARYRAGAYKAAIEALEASMRLQAVRSSPDLLFIAMAQWRLGRKADARKSYVEAVAWMKAQSQKDEELERFHVEARELLGIEASGEK